MNAPKVSLDMVRTRLYGDASFARRMHNLRAFILRCGPRSHATKSIEKCLSKWVPERGNKLKFEINGQMFFVNFVPEEGRWFCYAPTPTGMQKIPVSMDTAPFDASFMTAMDEEAKEVLN